MGCNSSNSGTSREAPIANTSERNTPKSVPRSNTFEAAFSVDPDAVTPFECPLAGNKKSLKKLTIHGLLQWKIIKWYSHSIINLITVDKSTLGVLSVEALEEPLKKPPSYRHPTTMTLVSVIALF